MPWKEFNATFAEELKDHDFAAAYLEAASEEDGLETFLTALQNVAKANAGNGVHLSADTGVAEMAQNGRRRAAWRV